MQHGLCGVALAAAVLCVACDRKPEGSMATDDSRVAAPRAAATPQGLLATVNGASITAADVRVALRLSGTQLPPERIKPTVETLIRRELSAQRAVALNLSLGEQQQQQLALLQAQVAAFRRDAYAELFDRQAIVSKVHVSDTEARAHFETHAHRIRTELHVWQILVRSEAQAALVLRDLHRGVPFEQVARAQFGPLPPGARPWDLGYLRWRQLPEPWRATVYELKPGQTSGMVRGPSRRYWVLRLVDRRENVAATFDQERAGIVEELTAIRIQRARSEAERKLRQDARVVTFAP